MSLSNYCENYLLNLLFTNKTIYVAYGTAASETSLTEPVGNNYARKAYGSWSLTSVGVDTQEVTNDNDITFNASTGSQGTITHIGFFDALSSGNFIGAVSLDDMGLDDIVVISGTQIQLDAGDCKCQIA